MFLVCGEALFDFFLEAEDGPGAAGLRGARRRLAVQRRGRPVAARLRRGAPDRAVGRHARQAAGPGARGRGRLDRLRRRDLAADDDQPRRPRRRGRARIPVLRQRLGRHRRRARRPAAARAPTSTACTSARTRSPSRRSADAFAGAGRGRARAASSRSTRTSARRIEPDMEVWRARLDALFPLADLVKTSAEDLALIHPGRSAGGLRRRPDRARRQARRGDRRRRGGDGLDRRRPRAPRPGRRRSR